MKYCSRCGIDGNNFGPNKKTKDGLDSWCKDCRKITSVEYRKTKKGLVTKIYGSQRQRSKRRGHDMPDYSKEELKEWLFSQDNFELLYTNWVESGYEKMLVPSIDRLDDYKPYTIGNIKLITWKENKEKGHRDMINGVNNKKSKAVIATNIHTGEKLKFYSQKEAERRTGIRQGDLGKCCNGKRKTAGGFIWKYK